MTSHIPLLEARSLTLRRGTREVLGDFSCAIHRGEIMGVSGPNGAGKSTLLKAFAGIHQPSSGTIRRATKKPGYVPQHAPVDRNFPLTASEFLAINRHSRLPWIGGIPRKLRHGICGKLDCLGIAHLASRPLGSLSGGDRSCCSECARLGHKNRTQHEMSVRFSEIYGEQTEQEGLRPRLLYGGSCRRLGSGLPESH